MILNIIDNRENKHRWTNVLAIIEPTWHDNSCNNSDQSTPCEGEEDYAEKKGISLSDAIKWAENLSFNVTLYIYDIDGNKTIRAFSDPTKSGWETR